MGTELSKFPLDVKIPRYFDISLVGNIDTIRDDLTWHFLVAPVLSEDYIIYRYHCYQFLYIVCIILAVRRLTI